MHLIKKCDIVIEVNKREESERFAHSFYATKGGPLMNTVVETVTNLVTPIVENHHFELVDVEFTKEGNDWFLRVYIDKEGGIDIDECVMVSEQLSEKLDETDPIEQAYFLEVSSPGAERPLKTEKDWETALANNAYIHVSLYQKVDGEKQFEGVLLSCDHQHITLKIRIKTRTKEVMIERKNIAKARLAIQM